MNLKGMNTIRVKFDNDISATSQFNFRHLCDALSAFNGLPEAIGSGNVDN
jgi:hypothetical protein